MADQIEIGSVVRGKYRVERLLGEGGMGMVLGAWHELLGQRVALKVLRPDLVANPGLLERFKREAQAASRIRSDHVARVIDVDALADGTPFMVMEYLEGQDLAALLQSPLPYRTAIEYVLQACDAIAEAHALGIIHRDIKPANLFLTRTREGKPLVKVLDFGISKIEKTDSGNPATVTKTSAVMGSAVYMSPEQMLSARDVDARTDIWSLGVTLYELCTGDVPFLGETLPQVCALVMNKPPPPPRTLRPDLPAELEVVILRCLDKDRDARFASVAELCWALAPIVGDRDPTEVAKLAHAVSHGTMVSASTRVLPRLVDDVSPTVPGQGASIHDAPTRPAESSPMSAKAAITTAPDEATPGKAAPEPAAPVAAVTGRPSPKVLAAVVVLAAVIVATFTWVRGRGEAVSAAKAGEATTAVAPAVTPSAPVPTATATEPSAPSVTPDGESKASTTPPINTPPPEVSAASKLPAKKPAGPKPPAPRPSAGPSVPAGPSIY